MIINHNIAALNTHRQLSTASSAQSKSMEKLASGLRINKAGDDAAGLAISEKMRGQIRGLDQASRNSQDAISLIQTAEGALNETHDILQRMRELSVQSSNDTNTLDDRKEIQKEVAQLSEEIDRIATTTEFNTKTLLNGKVSTKITADGSATSGVNTTAATKDGVYTLDVTAQATKAIVGGAAKAQAITSSNDGKININNVEVNLEIGDTIKDVVDKINLVSDKTGAKALIGDNGGLVLESAEVGSAQSLLVTGDNASLVQLGLTAGSDTALSSAGTDAQGTLNGVAFTAEGNKITGATGNDVEGLSLQLAGTETAATGTLDWAGNVATAGQSFVLNGTTINLSVGNTLSQAVNLINAETGSTGVVAKANDSGDGIELTTQAKGSNAKIEITSATAADGGIYSGTTDQISWNGVDTNEATGVEATGTSGIDFSPAGNTDGNIRVSSEDTLNFQIGANEGQSLRLSINDMSASKLGGLTANDKMDKIDVTTQEGAKKAISNVDAAIKQVSTERSKLGATQNRLEHTINNLNTSSENLTAAESRVRDVDMAKEMMTQTKNSILSQAAQAMLAQANQQPQGVLQLLR